MGGGGKEVWDQAQEREKIARMNIWIYTVFAKAAEYEAEQRHLSYSVLLTTKLASLTR